MVVAPRSCLYECRVMHHRLAPTKHRFEHKIFMFYLDLDEIPTLNERLLLFSSNRANVYSFEERDHLPLGGAPLKHRLIEYLKGNGIVEPVGRVMLLTSVRVFGYVFNPVSFYFCFNTNDEPLCAVAEVSNTFAEMKAYFVPPGGTGHDSFVMRDAKLFYISPFVDLDITLQLDLKVPGYTLALNVNDYDGDKLLLSTSLTGTRKELTNTRLIWYAFKYPLVTWKVIFLIHFHALILTLKGVPHHRKEANPHLQRNVIKPLASLRAARRSIPEPDS